MVDIDVDRSRAVWWGIGGCLSLIVLLVIYSFIGTFVFGLFIYYATRPAYVRIHLRIRRPAVSAVLSLLVFALPVIGLLAYTAAIAIQEASRFSQLDSGPLSSLVAPYVDLSQAVENPAELLAANGGLNSVTDIVVSTLSYVTVVGKGLLHLFVMFAIAYYLLRDGRRLSQWVVQFGDKRGVLEAYASAVDNDLESIFFGNILHAIITAALAAISYSILNFFAPPALEIPYPALLGLLTGVASLIPVVGMKLVYVPVTGYLGVRAAVEGSGYGFPILFFIVAFIGVDSIADFLLRPYVSGRDLHIGMVMFAYILGPLMFGWYGIFLGPVILVVVYHFARFVVPELLTSEPIRPVAVDPGYLTNPMSTPPPGDTDRSVSDGGEPTDENDSRSSQESQNNTD